ncbi:hypothetical protein BC829DRAFT_418200 [Chytridium lagenaria]|nr:hypothetical protein BC829DRAFT_418200 [Chytridium lagenaria]
MTPLLPLLLLITTASCDVVITPSIGAPSQLLPLTLRIFKGCIGVSPTVNVSIDVPTEIQFININRKSGWDVETLGRDVPGGVMVAGENVTRVVSGVRWTGGLIRQGEFEDFNLLVQVPNGPDGSRLYFPVIQTCQDAQSLSSTLRTTTTTQIFSNGTFATLPAPSLTIATNGTLTPQMTASVTFPTTSQKGGAEGRERMGMWTVGVVLMTMLWS